MEISCFRNNFSTFHYGGIHSSGFLRITLKTLNTVEQQGDINFKYKLKLYKPDNIISYTINTILQHKRLKAIDSSTIKISNKCRFINHHNKSHLTSAKNVMLIQSPF